MVVKELMREAPEQFQGHAAAVLPLAYVARSDEEADVASVWGEVWEEGGTSLRLYVPDIIPLVLRGTRCLNPKPYISLRLYVPEILPLELLGACCLNPNPYVNTPLCLLPQT